MMHLSSKVFFPLFYTDHLEDLVCGLHVFIIQIICILYSDQYSENCMVPCVVLCIEISV